MTVIDSKRRKLRHNTHSCLVHCGCRNGERRLISWWRKFLKCLLSCLRLAGLYSLLVNYSLWRGKLTQISISKRYESSHFPCTPPEKRVEGDCRSSLQWYAACTGLLSYRSNTRTQRISSFLLKRGMRSLGFLCKVNSEARHIMFKIQAYPQRALETHCASRGTCFPLCKEAPGLK